MAAGTGCLWFRPLADPYASKHLFRHSYNFTDPVGLWGDQSRGEAEASISSGPFYGGAGSLQREHMHNGTSTTSGIAIGFECCMYIQLGEWAP